MTGISWSDGNGELRLPVEVPPLTKGHAAQRPDYDFRNAGYPLKELLP
jgi:hypothetical protein